MENFVASKPDKLLDAVEFLRTTPMLVLSMAMAATFVISAVIYACIRRLEKKSALR